MASARALRTAATRPRTTAAVAAFVVVAAVLAVRVLATLNVAGAPAIPAAGLQDFRDAVYYPARAFLDGRNPYDTAAYFRAYPVGYAFSWYLPATLLLHAPLALLPYAAAEVAYFGALLVLVLVTVRTTLRACDVAPTTAAVFGLAALVLASRPGHWTVAIGQPTAEAIAGTLVALAWGRDRPWLGGLGLALALCKPTFGVPLMLLLAVRGERRAVLIGGALAAVASAVATAVLAVTSGAHGLLRAFGGAYAAFASEASVDPPSSWSRVDALGLVGHLLGWSPDLPTTIAVGLAVLGLGALGVARLAAMDTAAARRASSALACLTVVACTYHQGYDLLLLVLPLATLVVDARAWPWRDAPQLRRALLVVLAIPAVNYLGSETALGLFGLPPGVWLVATTANGVALLAALLGFGAIATRGAPAVARSRDARAPRVARAVASQRTGRVIR